MDVTVLSYHDHLLRNSDLKLLEKGNWINDNIIGFMFEYFHYNEFDSNRSVTFVDPDVVQLIKLCSEEDAEQILLPLNLHSMQLIFLPLNDNDEAASTGGTHWSLLVLDLTASVAEHYDSCQNFHVDVAASVFRIFSKILCKNRDSFRLQQMPVARQVNGYDCGIYVIKIAEEVCRSKLQEQKWSAIELTSDNITEYRRKIKDLILKLSKKQ